MTVGAPRPRARNAVALVAVARPRVRRLHQMVALLDQSGRCAIELRTVAPPPPLPEKCPFFRKNAVLVFALLPEEPRLRIRGTLVALAIDDGPVLRPLGRFLMLANIVNLTRHSILGLALVLTFGATLAVPTFAAPRYESRRDSRFSYSAGFRDGYRKGYVDGRRDARSERRNQRSFRSILPGDSPFDRGFENGYERGYRSGFNSVSRRHRDDDRRDRDHNGGRHDHDNR
jgi:hypothetical protein